MDPVDKYELKYQAAQHFLERIRDLSRFEDADELDFYFQAFLGATRSISQYMYEEAKRRGRVAGYEKLVLKLPLVRYFRELRNEDAHEAPVQLERGMVRAQTRTADGEQVRLVLSDGSNHRELVYTVAGYKLPGGPFEEHEGVNLGCIRYLDELWNLIVQAEREGIIERPSA